MTFDFEVLYNCFNGSWQFRAVWCTDYAQARAITHSELWQLFLLNFVLWTIEGMSPFLSIVVDHLPPSISYNTKETLDEGGKKKCFIRTTPRTEDECSGEINGLAFLYEILNNENLSPCVEIEALLISQPSSEIWKNEHLWFSLLTWNSLLRNIYIEHWSPISSTEAFYISFIYPLSYVIRFLTMWKNVG